MSRFIQLLSAILELNPKSPVIKIRNTPKIITGMSRFVTKHYPDSAYIKIVFADHSLMLIVIGEEEIYYANDPLGRIESITDNLVVTADKISFNGKDYEVVNQNDYQFVVQKYIGGINDIEGECIFSDFASVDGNKSILSLGIISATGERADVYCEQMSIDDIQV